MPTSPRPWSTFRAASCAPTCTEPAAKERMLVIVAEATRTRLLRECVVSGQTPGEVLDRLLKCLPPAGKRPSSARVCKTQSKPKS